jgi:8-oxo-dGTP diphosphatase
MAAVVTNRPLFLVHVSVAVMDRDGRVLLVEEGKEASRNKWNLPGGHVDHNEPLPIAAERELREETGLTLPLQSFVGVYRGTQSIRFVFRAEFDPATEPVAGDEILAVQFAPLSDLAEWDDSQIVSPKILRAIAHDLFLGVAHPLSIFSLQPE